MKTLLVILSLFVVCSSVSGEQQGPIVIENAHVRYTISAEGRNLGFADLATGTDYLKSNPPSVCALVRCNGTEYPATSVRLEDGRLTIEFGRANVTAILRIDSQDSYIRLAVESATGHKIE